MARLLLRIDPPRIIGGLILTIVIVCVCLYFDARNSDYDDQTSALIPIGLESKDEKPNDKPELTKEIVVDTQADPEAWIALVFVNKSNCKVIFRGKSEYGINLKWWHMYINLVRIDSNGGFIQVGMDPMGLVMIVPPPPWHLIELHPGEQYVSSVSLKRLLLGGNTLVPGDYQLKVDYSGKRGDPPISPIEIKATLRIKVK